MKFTTLASIATLVCATGALPMPWSVSEYFKRADSDSGALASAPFSNATTNSTTATNSTSASSSGTSIKLFSFSDEFTTLYLGSSSSNSSNSSSLPISESEVVEIFGLNSKVNTSTMTSFSIGALFNATESLNTTTIDYEQLSDSFNETVLLDLYQAVADDEPDYDGIIVVLDTADIESAAFFVDIIESNFEIPVVFTTAVGLKTLISGVNDLYNAITVVSDGYNATDSGVLIVSNKLISSALYTTRVTTTSGDSITSSSLLGEVNDGSIQWFFENFEVPSFGGNFTLESNDSLPEVVVLEYYSGFSTDIIDALASSGVEGLILSSSSVSDFSSDVTESVSDIDIPVVFASSAGGIITPDDLSSNSTIAAGLLSPVKAKILLQVALGSGYETDEVKDVFSVVYGG